MVQVKKLLPEIVRWLPTALVITLLSGMVYATSQYSIRSAADDPQVQLAEDVAKFLEGGQPPQLLASSRPIDMKTSLSPFLIAYDKDHKPVAGSGQVDGAQPTPPDGVFGMADRNGENRFSWEPQPGVRVAAVLRKYEVTKGESKETGYVLAGRSLREVEKREQQLMMMVALGWAVTMLSSLVVPALIQCIPSKLAKKSSK